VTLRYLVGPALVDEGQLFGEHHLAQRSRMDTATRVASAGTRT
jgi:hypothetical protein